MTALERQLIKTFRLARWNGSAGQPICAACFDGHDLADPTDDPLTPGLSRYHCTVCRTEFGDTTGTVFDSRKPTLLMLWAYLVLLGDPGRVAGITQQDLKRCWVLAAKLKERTLPKLWRERLEAEGLTAEGLRKRLSVEMRRLA